MFIARYLILLFVCAIGSAAFAQQKIKRIGPIRLGMSYAEMIDTLGIPRWSFADPNLQNVSNADLQQPRHRYRLYYDKESSPDSITYYRKCPHAVVVILPKVVIPSTALSIGNVHLTFYKDSLAEVRINDPSPELISLIKRRFGKGAERKEEVVVGCAYPYGGYTRKETLHLTAWSDPEGATLIYSTYNGVTKWCTPTTVSYVQFYSNGGLAGLEGCVEKKE